LFAVVNHKLLNLNIFNIGAFLDFAALPTKIKIITACSTLENFSGLDVEAIKQNFYVTLYLLSIAQ
jgi:hypothetical protein